MQRYQDEYNESLFSEPYPREQPRHEPRIGTMESLVLMAIGIMTLMVVFIIIPLTAAPLDLQVSALIPGTGAGSQWNSTVTPTLPTAVGLWQVLAGVLKVAGVITLMIGFFSCIRGVRGK